MKVSLSWLKELVDLNLSPEDLAAKLSVYTIGVKDQTKDYLELDLTYNRGDLLSLRGVAREISAITGSRLLFSAVNLPDYHLPQTPVEIEDEELATVQCVAKIEGLKFGKSPGEWVEKLETSGMRPVNNIVDVTNLTMLEYGQPLHSFDAATVKDETINVRKARNGEEIRTLDNKLRKLTSEDIILADTEKPLDVAGVMGGKDTEVKETTTTILLTASIFNPSMIRKTSKRLGLYSEASKRFQHGLTKTNLLQALSATIKMYESLGGKLTAITMKGNLEDKIKTVTLSQEKINSLIGENIPAEQVKSLLEKLGFTVNNKVTVPYWRLDINIEEDLIEEVARMYGYEKIMPKELSGQIPPKLDQTLQKNIYSLKQKLANAGLTEIQTYSFYSTKVIENCKLKIENFLRVANPISSETEYMRDNLWPNLLETVAKNIRNGIKDVVIFEIGKVYLPKVGDLPKETYHLSIALSNSTNNPIAELSQIAKDVHLGGGLLLTPRELFHPTRYKDNMAEIHPRYVNKFGIDQRVAVLEMEITATL